MYTVAVIPFITFFNLIGKRPYYKVFHWTIILNSYNKSWQLSIQTCEVFRMFQEW